MRDFISGVSSFFSKEKIIGIIILLAALSFSTYSFLVAQEEVVYEGASDSIHVSYIQLEKDIVSSGGKISGSFDITNVSDQVISGVTYKIELVNIFEESLEYEGEDGSIEDLAFDQISAPFASSDLSSAMSISPGSITVPFEYNIPNSIPEGRIGLVISTYSSNELSLGYDFVEIDVTGERTKYATILTNVSVTDKDSFTETFGPLEGPRIIDGDSVKLVADLFSGEEDSVKVTPQIKIYSGNNVDGEQVYSNKFSIVDLVSGEQSFSYDLPTNFSPGVYTGTIEYLNNDGTSKTVASEFRYIIDKGALKPKLGEVVYNTLNLVDENLVVSVSYIDTPFSFRKNSDGTYKDSRVQKFVELNKDIVGKDLLENDEELSLISSQSFLEGMEAEVRVTDLKTNKVISNSKVEFINSALAAADLGRLKGVDQVMVEVDLYQNGEKIDNKVDFTEFETYEYKNIFDKIWYKYRTLASVIVLLVILVIIALAVKHSKVNKNTGIAALIAVLMVGSSYITVQHTGSVSAYGTDESFLTRVVISSPKPPNVDSYEPGANIRFIADTDFMYCTNSGYDLKARITRPVLQGRPHTGFGGWVKLPKGKFIQTMYNYAPLGRYDTGINLPIKAPNVPGIYTFKFQIVAVSGGWGDQEQGVVRFRVAKDVCKNINGVQETVPAGYEAARNRNGAPICNRKASPVTLNCSASKNRLSVGESVTYTARTVAGTRANFNWYKARETSAANLVKSQNNVAVSTYATSYNNPGVYYTTALATASGQTGRCTLVVSVGEDFWDDPELDDEDPGEDDSVVEQYWTDDEGNRYLLDPNAPPGTIEFNMPNALTNSTCGADWTAQHVIKCSMYRGGEKLKSIGFSGNENLNPGMYQIRCNQLRDGAEISSEVRTCTLNPDLRED